MSQTKWRTFHSRSRPKVSHMSFSSSVSDYIAFSPHFPNHSGHCSLLPSPTLILDLLPASFLPGYIQRDPSLSQITKCDAPSGPPTVRKKDINKKNNSVLVFLFSGHCFQLVYCWLLLFHVHPKCWCPKAQPWSSSALFFFFF